MEFRAVVCKIQRSTYRHYSEFEDCKDVMQFRLTYEGELKPTGNNTRNSSHKHEIRRAFHPQLKALWETNINLRSLAETPLGLYRDPFPIKINKTEDPDTRSLLQYISDNYPLEDYRFVPLVTREMSLWCGLDILFLRPTVPGNILSGGDIDNRIKTLFDALKRPSQLSDLGPSYMPPSPSENPFFVLLEDDSLVAKLAVETDTMLEPIVGGIPRDTDARLVITVTVRPIISTVFNMSLT